MCYAVMSKNGLSYKTLSGFRMLPEISNLTCRAPSQSAKGKINIASRRAKKLAFLRGKDEAGV
jgi:hypothetical protein